ncbi:MAG: Spy/CpxP family protein refolding chaperone [Acidiferrobacterales bacterium]
MSKQDTVKSEDQKPKCQRRTRHGFFSGLVVGGLVATLLVGALGAYSHGGYYRHGGYDAQTAATRAEFATDWVLSQVNATEEQRTQVKAIVSDAINDLYAERQQHRESHQAFFNALTQPTVDRQALDEIRRLELQRAENLSGRFVQAIADAAEVLTPEQRNELVELAGRFGHR